MDAEYGSTDNVSIWNRVKIPKNTLPLKTFEQCHHSYNVTDWLNKWYRFLLHQLAGSSQGVLRWNWTPNQKLACFVLYLKIINTFLKNNIYIL